MISFLRKFQFSQSPIRWALNCDFHNWTLHDLTSDQAQVVVETLRDSEKSTLLVWRTGWAQWRALRDPECSELLHTRAIQIEAPPLPSQEEFDPEITAVRPVKVTAPFQTRKFHRHEVDLAAQVISGNQEFSTRVLDLSEGGIRLRDSVPDWVAGYCNIIVHVSENQVYELLCSMAEDQKQFRTRFEIVENDVSAEYVQWVQQNFANQI